ncbi:MAG: hypothetical protein QM498_03020 [Desulfobacterium sp.]
MQKISACTLDCQDSCSTVVKIDPENGRVRITGNPDHPFTRGFICKKGHPSKLHYTFLDHSPFAGTFSQKTVKYFGVI